MDGTERGTKRKRSSAKDNGTGSAAATLEEKERALLEVMRSLRPDSDLHCYNADERAHWIAQAAAQGMDEEQWKEAMCCYPRPHVEQALSRQPWETCAMCRNDWANARYLLRRQMGPITDFRNSAVPGPLYMISRHRCKPRERYDPQRGRYPTLRSWRQAWRGESSFPPFVHLAQICIDARARWAKRAATDLAASVRSRRLTKLDKHRVTVMCEGIHDRRQCPDVAKELKGMGAAGTRTPPWPGCSKTIVSCTLCHCFACGTFLRGSRFQVCDCRASRSYRLCYLCYVRNPPKPHAPVCLAAAMQMAGGDVRAPHFQRQAADPIPTELLLRLPAEICHDIVLRVIQAHKEDLLPVPKACVRPSRREF